MAYVVHFCKNPECNNCWVDKDITQVSTYPPKWKYCKKCCAKFGIDFDKQKPSDKDRECSEN